MCAGTTVGVSAYMRKDGTQDLIFNYISFQVFKYSDHCARVYLKADKL